MAEHDHSEPLFQSLPQLAKDKDNCPGQDKDNGNFLKVSGPNS
jgi:hypothetical protein